MKKVVESHQKLSENLTKIQQKLAKTGWKLNRLESLKIQQKFYKSR